MIPHRIVAEAERRWDAIRVSPYPRYPLPVHRRPSLVLGPLVEIAALVRREEEEGVALPRDYLEAIRPPDLMALAFDARGAGRRGEDLRLF